jgi:PKD repeat protein
MTTTPLGSLKQGFGDYQEVITEQNANLAFGGQQPLVNFSASPLSGASPLTVSFIDQTTFAVLPAAYLWSFGDGVTSPLKNPSHTFTAGKYSVSLTVTDTTGSYTAIKEFLVSVTP